MKRILIIGAGFLQDFVICKAKEMGYYTIAIDGDPNAVGLKNADRSAIIDIVDQEACLKFAKSQRIDGVMTAATDYGVLSASYVAGNLGLPGISYRTAKLIKNKYEVRKCLINAKVDDAIEAFEINSNTDLFSLHIHYPVIVKPSDGSGSRAAIRVNKYEELSDACNTAITASLLNRAVVESFIEGHEYGAESIVVNGEIHVLGIMKKWMTNPPYYAELGHQFPSDLSEEMEAKASKCVEKAIKALGINHGAVNMDLIISKTGNIHIIDVGARMGGNMIGPCIIPIGTGIQYLENLIRITVGDAPNWNKAKPERVATRLLAFNKGVINKLPQFSELEKKYGVRIYHHMKEGDIINEYHTNLDGCGYIIAYGKDASHKADTVLSIIANSLV